MYECAVRRIESVNREGIKWIEIAEKKPLSMIITDEAYEALDVVVYNTDEQMHGPPNSMRL